MRCEECGTVAETAAKGWEAHIAEDSPPFVVIYCPRCAEREFGPRVANRNESPS
jgi:hypothetical protein